MQSIEIDFFRPPDAPGVARLFRQVYGEGYPVRTYYEPDKLIAENDAGRVISSVARTQDGEIIGHDALVLLDPESRLFENAAGAVLPDFRGGGIFFRIFKHSIQEAANRFDVKDILGEPVCNHTQLQKMCMQLGYKETGLEVDLMPASAYTKEQSARDRVSVLLGYFRHKSVPRSVYLPSSYRDELRYFYSGLGLERTFNECKANLPAEGNSKGKMALFEFAQVARITIDCIGSEFNEYISQLENEAVRKGVEILQIWLPLSSPFITAAVEVLRSHDCFIGGLSPVNFNGDILLMQKVSGKTDWNSIALYSERAKQIAEIVRNDQMTTRR